VFSVQGSVFSVRCSVFSVQCSVFTAILYINARIYACHGPRLISTFSIYTHIHAFTFVNVCMHTHKARRNESKRC
jgi:hypothetical protein